MHKFTVGLVASAAVLLAASPAIAERPNAVNGEVWLDVNEDGVRQAGEPPMAGVLVGLPGRPANATTDERGRYRLTGLADGTYEMEFARPLGHGLTKPGRDSDVDWLRSGRHTVTVRHGSRQRVDAGYRKAVHDKSVGVVVADRPVVAVGERFTFQVFYANFGNVADQVQLDARWGAGLRLESITGDVHHVWEREATTLLGAVAPNTGEPNFVLATFVATAPGDLVVEFSAPADVEGDATPQNNACNGYVSVTG
ncbi:SdrD B-like domain-containing protein [Lentzea sp. DG1S-22]|uniref:SdrD B-like domain-containing protein n=1 Tax=Lentzea sp. DG1S-22 TaxID=3108822 RepID=UPI002E798418|nr:SdrD B-like domain-containing protein [Lentzea sp. DG1S-22]WVH79044.1 SdrD B-like domain-containing protein [Lentzea sp. DG1S-22]